MASSEMQLVCKIIKTGELKQVIEWGITEDDFLSTEPKQIYKMILSIYQNPDTLGSIIGPQMSGEKFAQLDLNAVDTNVSVEHLCKEIRKRRLAKDLKEGALRAIDMADMNPDEALSALQLTCSNVMRLDAGKQTDVEWGVGLDEVIEDHDKIKSGVSTSKFTWPWAPLQDESMGGQKDDYVVFYGRPKSMKSWVLCYLIAWLVSTDLRVLVYTKEMTTQNIYRRIAACLANLPYDDLRRGKLTSEQMDILNHWVSVAKKMSAQNRLVVLSAKDVSGRDTVSWLGTKIEKYYPDVVCVDGLYLMSPENQKITKTNERVESISRAMRALILSTGTPVLATMQANRKAAGHDNAEFDEIAFSDSLSQDCTMGIRVIKNKTEPTISLVFAGAREIKFAGLCIKAQPCTDFGYHSLLTDKDIQKAKKDDDVEEETAKAASKRQPATAKSRAAAGVQNFEKNLNKALEEL